MLRTLRTTAVAGLLAFGWAALPSAPAHAANGPTFRDCSLLVDGIDPDFVQLDGVTVTPQGALTVAPSQNVLPLVASESSDPGDQSQQLTITVTVSSGKGATRVISGAGTGRVVLSVPLVGAGLGRTFTIGWAAVFDNGQHACPGPLTTDNMGPDPFVVTVT